MPRTSKWTRANTNRPEILQILHQEHTMVKALFWEFQKLAEEEEWDEATALAMTIVTEIEGHADREEQIVYPRLRELDEGMFFETEEEHALATMLMAEIKDMTSGDERFSAKMKVLKDVVQHHIEEESEVFGELRQLSREDLRECAEAWREQTGVEERAAARAA